MSQDRFVYWSDTRPTLGGVAKALVAYLGDAATITSGADHRLVATFPQPSSPTFQDRAAWPGHAERWFEVFEHEGAIDVITRQQDEFVNAVADGFAAACARHWSGRLE